MASVRQIAARRAARSAAAVGGAAGTPARHPRADGGRSVGSPYRRAKVGEGTAHRRSGGADAGDGHRDQHRHLHGRRQRALEAAPVRQPDGLVAIGKLTVVNGNTTGGARADLFSVPLYHDVRARARTVSQLAATGTAGRLDVRLTTNGEFEHPNGRFVSENYFQVLGVRAQRGRTFGVPEGGAPGSSPVAVISDAYW